MTDTDLDFAAVMDRNKMICPRFLPNLATPHNYAPGTYVLNETLEDLCQLDVTLIVRVTVGAETAEGPLEDFWDFAAYHPEAIDEILIVAIE